MTTLTVVDGYRPSEGRAQAIARRLRSELAALNIKGARAARIVGVTQPWMSRRLNGAVAFAVDELDMICEKLGISFEYVTTGSREVPEIPPRPPSATAHPFVEPQAVGASMRRRGTLVAVAATDEADDDDALAYVRMATNQQLCRFRRRRFAIVTPAQQSCDLGDAAA